MKTILEFDMTGYLPGANSLSGWIVGQIPASSLAEIFKNGLCVNIRNLRKIRGDDTNTGMFYSFLNDVANLSRQGVEINFQGDKETDLFSVRHCFG